MAAVACVARILCDTTVRPLIPYIRDVLVNPLLLSYQTLKAAFEVQLLALDALLLPLEAVQEGIARVQGFVDSTVSILPMDAINSQNCVSLSVLQDAFAALNDFGDLTAFLDSKLDEYAQYLSVRRYFQEGVAFCDQVIAELQSLLDSILTLNCGTLAENLGG